MATDCILCADCGQKAPMDRLLSSFGLCHTCETKHQQRVLPRLASDQVRIWTKPKLNGTKK